MPVKRRGHVGQRGGTVRYQHVGRGGVQRSGQLFANHGRQPLPHGGFDKLVAVGGRAAQGAKGDAWPRLARVERETGDEHIGRPVLGQHGNVGEQGKERQGNHDGN